MRTTARLPLTNRRLLTAWLAVLALATTLIGSSPTRVHAAVVGACLPRANAQTIIQFTSQLRQQGKTQKQIDAALAKNFGLHTPTSKPAPKGSVTPNVNAVPSDVNLPAVKVYTAGGGGCGTPYGYAEADWNFTNGKNGKVTTECSTNGGYLATCHDAEDAISIVNFANDGSNTGVSYTSFWAQTHGIFTEWKMPSGSTQPWNYTPLWVYPQIVNWPMTTYDGFHYGSGYGTDFSAYYGAAGTSFVLPQGVPCKWYSFQSIYSHSWVQTGIDSISLGIPWSVNVSWSKTGGNWQRTPSVTPSQYYLCS